MGSHTPIAQDPSGVRQAPERRCLVLQESGPRDALIRFVLSPDGIVTPDLTEKLPGRGCYVTADPALIQQAVDKKLFARAFKQPCTAPADLIDMVGRLLRARLEAQLGLAKKASLAVLGEEAVSLSLRSKKLDLILVARDASARTAADLRHSADRSGTAIADLPLDASMIGTALGRNNTVYLGIVAGKMAKSLMRDCARLTPFVTKTLK